MKRMLFGLALFAWMVLVIGSMVQAQDKVIYTQDPAKKKVLEQPGTIQSESPKEVVVKPNIGQPKAIPVNQIVEVVYMDQVKSADKATYRKADDAEHKTAADPKAKAPAKQAALTEALGLYQQVLANNKSGTATPLQRHLEYKVANLSARLAGDDKTKQKQAADLLAAFKKSYPNSWQIVSCTRSLTDLYVKVGDFEKAAGAFDDLKLLPGISEETKAECELEAAKNLNNAGKTAEAAGRITKIITTMPKTHPQYEPLSMMLIICNAKTPGKFKEAIGQLEKMIAASKDNARIALAYNALGECYLLNNQPKDALWQFLFVAEVYNQDKNEHRKAVAQLVKLFKDLKQPDRSKEYADRLERLK